MKARQVNWRQTAMIHHLIHTPFSKALAIAVFALQIVACGGSGGGSGTPFTTTSSGASPDPAESVIDPVVEETTPVAGTASLTLNWTAPVSRADGTPMSLADIDGYRIYYGDSAGSYPGSVDITDGSAVAATVNNIPAGTYYLVMSTYDVDGRESTYSSEISKTAQ